MNISNISIRWAPTERAGNSEPVILLVVGLKKDGQLFWTYDFNVDINELSTKFEEMKIVSFGEPGPEIDTVEFVARNQMFTHDVLVNGQVAGKISPDKEVLEFAPGKFRVALAVLAGLLGVLLVTRRRKG